MTRQRARRQHADSGAALLLAIGFVVMIGAISGGLAAVASSSMTNRTQLEAVRNREYAADGAIETAIGSARSATCSSFGGPTFDTSLNSVPIRVDWVNSCGVVQSSDGTVVAQRNVIFSACVGDAAAPCLSANVVIRAQVNFQQVSGSPVTKTYVQSWSVNR